MSIIEERNHFQLTNLLIYALVLGVFTLAFSTRSHAESATGRQEITEGSMTLDYVDGAGNSIANPSIAFSNATFSYDCTNVDNGPTADLNTANRKLQLSNATSNDYVTVSMGLNDPNDTWTATVAGTQYHFDANDGFNAGNISGQNQYNGGVTAGSDDGSNPASNATDNNSSTKWVSGQGTAGSDWLALDLGYSPYVGYYRVTLPDNQTASWTLEGSYDNSQWDSLDSQTDQSSGDYGISAYYQYYRLTISNQKENGNNAAPQVAEFLLLENYNYDIPPDGCQGNTGIGNDDGDNLVGNMKLITYDIGTTDLVGCQDEVAGYGSESILQQGVSDSLNVINLYNARACKLNLSGGQLRQSIPGGQTPGVYTINLIFTAA